MNVYTDNHLPAEPYDWRVDALCAQVPGDLWFPPKGTDSAEAKAICHACPVIAECYVAAQEMKVQFGIWAGLSIRQLNERRKKEEAA